MSLIQQNLQKVLSEFTPAQMSVILGGAQQPQPESKARRPITEKVMKQKPKIVVPPLAKSNTRPLNSFIAFRSYYSLIFSSMQQKNISGIVTYMWQHDLFQVKWTILAKAYSVIRDSRAKGETPLEQFLFVNGPYIGVPDPNDYLELMGWEVLLNDQGQMSLSRLFVPDTASFEESLRANSISVHDILQYSRERGYISANDEKLKISVMPAQQHLMATNPQPSSVPAGPVMPGSSIPGTQSTGAPIVQTSTQVETFTTQSNAATVGATKNTAILVNQAQSPEEASQHDKLAEKSVIQSPAVPWWRKTLDEFNAAGEQEFPFNNQFNPDIGTNLMFDPFEGNSFNPFELSDFIDEDAFKM